MDLDTPLTELPGLSPARLAQLDRLGLRTLADVLTHFPRRHEDRRRDGGFPREEKEEPVCAVGLVVKTGVKRFGGYKKMFEATLQEADAHALSPSLTCRWFNVHFPQKMIATGMRLVVYGKPKLRGGKIVMDHPEFEAVEEEDEFSIHVDRIAPVHPATEGLPPRALRQIVWDALAAVDVEKIETLVPSVLAIGTRSEALRQIHFPDSMEAYETARRLLVLEEFFAMQLSIASKRAEHRALPGEPHAGGDELMRRLHASLPFALTGAQIRAIEELRADLASPRPMNRLLHGDVGSGKTLVALSAALLCVEAGFDAAVMAPTQILAEQHYLTFRRMLEPLGVRVALRTGAREESGSAPGPGAAVGGSPTAPDQTYSKRRLPHFERPWAIYAITMTTRKRRWLNHAARDIVWDCIFHWKGVRYDLFAACVMPDHVHLLIQPLIENRDAAGNAAFFSLSQILHTLKSYTAHEINNLEDEPAPVWEKESFDRFIRTDSDLAEKFLYITGNPWAAELVEAREDYPWVWWPDRHLGKFDGERSASRRTRHPGRVRSPDTTPQILVGTHALLYDSVALPRLGLAVIDEQHKFGVMQRARLTARGTAPDVLVMTATPIPRTLTMTIYGDLDISVLDELPAHRGKIITLVRDESKLPQAAKFIREQLEAGRQAYIVYPLIEESAKLESKAATREFERWSELLAPMPCALLHGRVPPEEKDAIMQKYRAGETKALIATTVIEVGIDVPNATIMLVENAERFGLAQLHQLRGRIGRGEHKSHCILITGAKAEGAQEKLDALAASSDGFVIAEADLRLRGPGDLLGTAQSGLAPLKLGDPLRDGEWMRLARRAAIDLLHDDPALERPENQRFRQLIVESRALMLSQVS